jgi:hypothetical protein
MQFLKKSKNNLSSNFVNTILLTIQGGVALIILLLFFGIWRSGGKLISMIESFFAPSVPKIDRTGILLTQIRGVSELTTAVFIMEAMVPTSADRKLGEVVVATTKLLYIAQGEIRAGIDLSRLTPENIAVENDSIEIKLPPPEILDRKIDVDRSQVYDYDRGFLGLGPDVAPQLQTLAQQETLAKIVTNACDRGILIEANERSKIALTQLLTTAGYQKIEIKTANPSDAGCQFPRTLRK